MTESYSTNLISIASCYIKTLEVPVTFTTLKQNLLENPYYPSLFSLSNTFERFNIPHEAFTVEEENFEQLTPPYIAYLKNQPTGKDFVLVTSTNNNAVSYIAENRNIKTESKEKFLKNFEHIVLKATPDVNSGEKDYQLNRRKEIAQSNKNYLLTAVSVLIFISIVYFFLNSLASAFII